MFGSLDEVDTRDLYKSAGPVSQLCAYKGPDPKKLTWIKVVDVTYGYGAAAKKVVFGDPSILGGGPDVLTECVEIPRGTCVTSVAGDAGLFLENLSFKFKQDEAFKGLYATPSKETPRRDAPANACLGAVSGWIGKWFSQEQVTALQVDWVPQDKIPA